MRATWNVRSGNRVDAVTQGVTAFTLLISPDQFDIDKPLQVMANGREVWHGCGRVAPDLRTLLAWAARDNDRTMLYAAMVDRVPAKIPLTLKELFSLRARRISEAHRATSESHRLADEKRKIQAGVRRPHEARDLHR